MRPFNSSITDHVRKSQRVIPKIKSISFKKFHLSRKSKHQIMIRLLILVLSLSLGTQFVEGIFEDVRNLREKSSAETSEAMSSELHVVNINDNSGFAPIFSTNTSKHIWGYRGHWKEIICSVKANPSAKFSWSYRELPVIHSEVLHVLDPGNNFSILKVKIQESTLGEYSCRSENDFGASERIIILGMAAMPPIPEFRAVVAIFPHDGIGIHVTGFVVKKNHHPIAIGDNSLSSAGEILQVRGYLVQFRKFRSCDNWTTLKMSSERKFIRQDLIKGTQYRIRVATKTAAGVGEYSRAQTVDYFLNQASSSSEIEII